MYKLYKKSETEFYEVDETTTPARFRMLRPSGVDYMKGEERHTQLVPVTDWEDVEPE